MKTAGIVCEYNPFHYGHAYHIEKTRLQGATHIVCVMSGNFVQRGEPACVSKRVRARMAIENGADLVVELPLAWAVAGAESFASGAIGILDALGCVDMLSFGSESADTQLLLDCATALEDEGVCTLIRGYVGQHSYPAAVRRAVSEVFGDKTASCLDLPNDTLNVEYIRAIKRIESTMQPFCVKREQRHDRHTLSAMSIRNELFEGNDVSAFMPRTCTQLLETEMSNGFAPCSQKLLERAVLSRLRLLTVQEIKEAPEISQGLENRIYYAVRQARSLDELYMLIKTKRYTMAKVRRAVLCLYLGVKAENASGLPPYIRVLAANERGTSLLSGAKLPVLTRMSELSAMDEKCREIFELECRAGDLFALASPQARPCGTEMTDKALFL